jgi:hypothetical protein
MQRQLQLAAATELVMLIARRVYEAAAFTAPIRGALLPDADAIKRWRDRFLARWAKHGRRQFEGSEADVAAMAEQAAEPLARLRRLAEDQGAGLEAMFRAAQENAAARARGKAPPGERDGRDAPKQDRDGSSGH